MKIERKKNKDTTTLIFEGEMTIYHVSQIKEELFNAAEKLTDKIAFDLHQVTEIDTAGIQLLLFAKKHFLSLKKNLSISKSNESVDNLLRVLDINNQFVN